MNLSIMNLAVPYPGITRIQQDDAVIAVDNHRNAGRMHWLIMPKMGPATRHIRDIEALTADDLPLRMRYSILTPC